MAIAAYRLIQKRISNVVKHARATHGIAMVQVSDPEGARELRLAVVDDGLGFDTEHRQEGIGLIGVTERVCAFRARSS